MLNERTMRTGHAAVMAAAALQEFVNRRIQNGTPFVQLHDPEALAVVEKITVAVMQHIESMLSEPEQTAHARRSTR